MPSGRAAWIPGVHAQSIDTRPTTTPSTNACVPRCTSTLLVNARTSMPSTPMSAAAPSAPTRPSRMIARASSAGLPDARPGYTILATTITPDAIMASAAPMSGLHAIDDPAIRRLIRQVFTGATVNIVKARRRPAKSATITDVRLAEGRHSAEDIGGRSHDRYSYQGAAALAEAQTQIDQGG